MNISEVEYMQAVENDAGFCTECDAIVTDSGVEPDAEEYECPQCGNHTMMGIEQALIMDLIEFV